MKGGLLYAFEMSVVENVDPSEEYPEWGLIRVFDAPATQIGEYGGTGFPNEREVRGGWHDE